MNEMQDVFDAVRIISLPHRTDRRAEALAELRRAGLRLDGRRIAFFDALRPEDPAPFPSVGIKGCFLSHLGVLESAVGHGWDSVAILEDDFSLAPDFGTRMQAIAPELLSSDWQMFYGGHVLVKGRMDCTRSGFLLLAPAQAAIQTAHFVCFRGRKTIAAAVDHLQSLASRPPGDARGGPMHVDGAYNWLRRANPDWHCLLADPPLADQRPSRSDIADLPWWDRWAPLAPPVEALRRVRRKLRARGAAS